ncbi:MAG: sigma-70 family RNA polymerase sigma factor [Acidimicrobiia bacterium]|nr:sigma-70 family RNA polymerase sigma factor [Acidimicrobiia bacterium]
MTETAADTRFRRLYEEHHRAILSYFLRRTDRNAAYDATEDVYVTAWRNMDSVPEGEMELAWLYSVARGVLANHRRKVQRFSRLVRRIRNERPTVPLEPESQVILSFEHQAVLDALATLSDRDQEVLRLAVWEELPHAEIGEILGCSRGAIDVRVHRAMRRLVKAFDPSERKQDVRPAFIPEELS